MVFLCSPDNKPLREALDAPDGFLISRHRDYIERVVRSTHPHTVAFRELIDESTCVLYAFGLVGNRIYRAIVLNFNGQIFAGRRCRVRGNRYGCLSNTPRRAVFQAPIWRKP
jgi:hypothetical protein